jgi:hypothetical protein
MSSLEVINKKIERAAKRITALRTEREEILKRELKVTCGKCSTSTPIGELTYIQTHWYESPWGCTGGDTWHKGEGQTVCPGCSSRLRFINNSSHYSEHKYLFKDRQDEHDR